MVTLMNSNSHPWSEKETKKINKSLKNSRFGPVIYMAETGSTNTDLLNQVSKNVSDETVLVTGYQKMGRGRLDRHWEAPPETNLLFSVLLYPKIKVEKIPLITPALASALIDVLESYGLEAGMKWPNDVLLTGNSSGKVAGILAEIADTETPTVVIGMGCNVAWPEMKSSDLPNATSLLAAGKKIKPSILLRAILLNFEKYLTLLEQAQGAENLREILLQKSATIGKKVSVQQSNTTISGKAVDLRANGALVVESSDGLHHVMAGDITHLHVEE